MLKCFTNLFSPSITELISKIADDLESCGCEILYDTRNTNSDITKILIDPCIMNPLKEKFPWCIELTDEIFIDEGVTKNNPVPNTGWGSITIASPLLWNNTDWHKVYDKDDEYLYTQGKIRGLFNYDRVSSRLPLIYNLTVTEYGFALSVTNPIDIDGRGFFWLSVQRLTKSDNGEVLLDGESPVVCQYFSEVLCYNQNKKLNIILNNDAPIFFTVRDSNNMIPVYHSFSIDKYYMNKDDSYKWKNINTKKMILKNENNSFYILFPNHIHTNKYIYHEYRTDLIGYTAANLLDQDRIISIKLGKNKKECFYKSLKNIGESSNFTAYKEGIRILQKWNGE